MAAAPAPWADPGRAQLARPLSHCSDSVVRRRGPSSHGRPARPGCSGCSRSAVRCRLLAGLNRPSAAYLHNLAFYSFTTVTSQPGGAWKRHGPSLLDTASHGLPSFQPSHLCALTRCSVCISASLIEKENMSMSCASYVGSCAWTAGRSGRARRSIMRAGVEGVEIMQIKAAK